MKKMKIFIISGLLIFLLLLIYAINFYKNYQAVERERFKEAETALIKKVYHELEYTPETAELTTEQIGDLELLQFMPKTTSGEAISELNAKIEALTEKVRQQAAPAEPTKIFVTALPEKIQDNLTRYRVAQFTYQWNQREREWEEGDNNLSEPTLYNNKTGNYLTIGELFSTTQHLLNLQHHIQRDLLKNAANPEQDVEAILALPLLSLDETDFTYEPDHIVINYPKDSYVAEYRLDFKDVKAYLNKDYVKPEFQVEAVTKENNLPAKTVALTFDDGPKPETTPKVLETLAQANVRATFFMLGQQVNAFPDTARQVADAGHELANHSYSHPDLATLSADKVKEQINQTQAAIFKATGVLPTYVRPPYGSFTYDTAVAIGLPIVNWSVDSLDWKDKDVKALLNRVESQTGSQSIILMHDIQPTTVKALPKVIENLKAKGYQFVTVSEMLAEDEDSLVVHFGGYDQREITKK